jgi:LysR family transcriptional regulator, nitrogen assimilation regulatory protein
MKLRQLRYFAKIVECGSFSRAAAEVHIAQPALSQQVAELEQSLGVMLLHRGARGVRPTPAGQALYTEALEILRHIERLPSIVQSAGGEAQGSVKFGMSSTLAAVLGGPFMDVVKQALPKVILRFVTQDSQTLRAQITEQRIDLALVYEDQPVIGFVREPLFRQSLYLIQRKRTARTPQRVTLAHLASMPLVLPAYPNLVRKLLDDAFVAAGVEPVTVAEADVFSSMLSAVQSGIGDTILPKGDFSDSPGNTNLVAIPIEPPIYLTAVLISSRESALTTPVDAVREHFLAFARDHLRDHAVHGAEWIGIPEP